jgi:hypothetical protein
MKSRRRRRIITFDLKIHISDKGEMTIRGGHDGYPAYEIWVYREGRPPQQVYGFTSKGLLAPLNLGGGLDVTVNRKVNLR